jgi:tetrahydromethanopterin S-methyltransferase subunit B
MTKEQFDKAKELIEQIQKLQSTLNSFKNSFESRKMLIAFNKGEGNYLEQGYGFFVGKEFNQVIYNYYVEMVGIKIQDLERELAEIK